MIEEPRAVIGSHLIRMPKEPATKPERGGCWRCDAILRWPQFRADGRARVSNWDIEDSCGSESYCRHVEEIVREGTGNFSTYSAMAGII